MLNGPTKKALSLGTGLQSCKATGSPGWNPKCGQAQGICSEQMHENLVKAVGFHLPYGKDLQPWQIVISSPSRTWNPSPLH